MSQQLQRAISFYLAMLVSATGSLLFTIGLVTILPNHGYSLIQVSWFVVINRISPLVTSVFFPDFADRFDPQKILIITEILSGFLSLLLIGLFSLNDQNYFFILIIIGLKSLVSSLQVSSKAKLVKIYGGESFRTNLLTSSLYQFSTQGATLFAGVVGLGLLSFGSIQTIIAFDAATFLISGVLLMTLTVPKQEGVRIKKLNILSGLNDFYFYTGKIGIADLLIALVMSGYWTFNRKISQDFNASTPSYLLIIYGLSVMMTGICSNRLKVFNGVPLFCFFLGLSFLLFPFVGNSYFLLVSLVLVRDLSYWMIFHFISGKIQHLVPLTSTSVVSSFRTVQMVTILSLGETFSAASGRQWLIVECSIKSLLACLCFYFLVEAGKKQND